MKRARSVASRLGIGSILALAATFVLVGAAGAGQGRKWAETFEFAVVGGAALLDVSGANEDVDHDPGWSVGFLLGYNFNDWLGVQFEYNSLNTDALASASGLPPGDCVTDRCDVSTSAFGLAGLWNFPGERYFVHYAKISAGGYTTIAGDFSGSGGYVGFGLGTRFFPFEKRPLNLRLEAEIDGYFPGSAAIQGQDISGHSIANVRISAGIGWAFE